MSDQENKPPYYDEKVEEKNEKEDQKLDEKNQRDPLSMAAWALILIWAGLVLLASNLGWLEQISSQVVLPEGINLGDVSRWALILIGAGVIVFVEAIIRTFVPAYRSSTGGSFFFAAILLGIGLSMIFSWDLVWPFVLIALGLSTLISALVKRGR